MSNEQIAELSMMWAKEFARRLALARHVIDDLAQEAAISMLRDREAFREGAQSFKTWAKPRAVAHMRHFLNRKAAVVKGDSKMPESISLISPEAEEGTVGERDERTVPALSHENAEFNEALGRIDARTQLMIEAKLKGYTYDEIAQGFGVSREFVRRRVYALAESMGVA
jgi:RNA polymerase sigma factor (sigma-70 family)